MRCVFFFHRCAPTFYNKKYFDLWRGMEPLCVNTTVFLSRTCVTDMQPLMVDLFEMGFMFCFYVIWSLYNSKQDPVV